MLGGWKGGGGGGEAKGEGETEQSMVYEVMRLTETLSRNHQNNTLSAGFPVKLRTAWYNNQGASTNVAAREKCISNAPGTKGLKYLCGSHMILDGIFATGKSLTGRRNQGTTQITEDREAEGAAALHCARLACLVLAVPALVTPILFTHGCVCRCTVNANLSTGILKKGSDKYML